MSCWMLFSASSVIASTGKCMGDITRLFVGFFSGVGDLGELGEDVSIGDVADIAYPFC